MAEQTGRQSFRFRIPYWTNPQSTPIEPQPPTQPTIPTNRQLFRASTALQPPPQPQQAPTRTQAQAPSPSRTTSQPQLTTRTASQPPSPSRQASQLHLKPPTASQPPSPSRQAPRLQAVTQTTSQPPSPSRTASKPQSQTPSPSRTSQPQSTTRTTSQPPSQQTSQLQPKSPTASQPPPSRTDSKLQSQTTSLSRTSQQQSTIQTTSQPPSPSPSQQASQLQTNSLTTSQPQPPPQQTSQLEPKSPIASQLSSPSRQAPRSEAVTRTASQLPSPSRTNSKPPSPSRQASQPPSPSRKNSKPPYPSRQASQPPSPSRTASKTPSSSRQITQLQLVSQTSSPPSSPSREADQTQLTATKTASRPELSSHKASQNQPTLTQLPPKDPQHQEETSHQPALQSEAQILSRSETQDQTPPTKPTSQPVSLASQPTLVVESGTLISSKPTTATTETVAIPRSSETIVDSLNPTSPPKSETKLQATIDEEPQSKPETDQSEQPKAPTYEEPNRTMDAKLSEIISGQSKRTGGQSGIASRDITETIIVQPEQTGMLTVLNKKEATSIGSKGKESKQRKAESKTEIRALTSSGERATVQKEMKEGASRLVNKMIVGNQEPLSDEHNVNVITIAGENKGSSMHVGSEVVNKDGSLHIHRGYKLNKNDKAEVTNGEREGTTDRKLNHHSRSECQKPSITACINSNVQIINNSIMYNSCCDVRNPGVHLVVSSNPTKDQKLKGKAKVAADFSISSLSGGQNLTNQQQPGPRVRRRCLRGLFLESSESEGEDPQKPRRHGCRYNCATDNKKGGKDGEGNSSISNGRKNGKEVVASSSK